MNPSYQQMQRVKFTKYTGYAYYLHQSFSTSSASKYPAKIRKKNYYQDLGISSDSTQAQVKLAYYKLSKMYHPDIAKDSDTAATKFREITEAYEVLGNYKLRRRYDRGVLNPSDFFHRQPEAHEESRDATSKFYESREVKSRPPAPTGKSPIYNFDEFYRMHYGTTLEQQFTQRKKYEAYKKEQDRETQSVAENRHGTFWASSVLLIMIALLQVYSSSKPSVDIPSNDLKTKNSERSVD